jgi:hypothetical protein
MAARFAAIAGAGKSNAPSRTWVTFVVFSSGMNDTSCSIKASSISLAWF